MVGKGGGVELSLTDTAATLAAFPFRFTCNWPIAPRSGALAIKVRIENCGDEPMPYKLRPPPYFNVSGFAGPGAWPQPSVLVKKAKPVETLCGWRDCPNTVQPPDHGRGRPPRPAAAGWRLASTCWPPPAGAVRLPGSAAGLAP